MGSGDCAMGGQVLVVWGQAIVVGGRARPGNCFLINILAAPIAIAERRIWGYNFHNLCYFS